MPLESAASALLLVLVITRCLPPGDTVEPNFCTELSQKSLTNILGQAFNPRYMSIDPPDSPRSEHPLGGHKRSPNDIPFYADNDLVSGGELPAWETNHLSYFDARADGGGPASGGAAGEEVATLQRQRRMAFVDRITSKTEMFKSRPWECTSRIKWMDLGVNYFPRYIRSIECIAKKCWYGHFDCKPKSFTIKVLHRKLSSCIRVNDKLVMIAAEKFAKEYTELWIWKEVAVNFCCDCVMTY